MTEITIKKGLHGYAVVAKKHGINPPGEHYFSDIWEVKDFVDKTFGVSFKLGEINDANTDRAMERRNRELADGRIG